MPEQPQSSSKHQDHALKGVLEITRYGASHAGHDVELEFDRRLVVLNRARLRRRRGPASWPTKAAESGARERRG